MPTDEHSTILLCLLGSAVEMPAKWRTACFLTGRMLSK